MYARPGRAGITRSFLYDTLFPVALHRHAYAALYFALAVRAHRGTQAASAFLIENW